MIIRLHVTWYVTWKLWCRMLHYVSCIQYDDEVNIFQLQHRYTAFTCYRNKQQGTSADCFFSRTSESPRKKNSCSRRKGFFLYCTTRAKFYKRKKLRTNKLSVSRYNRRLHKKVHNTVRFWHRTISSTVYIFVNELSTTNLCFFCFIFKTMFSFFLHTREWAHPKRLAEQVRFRFQESKKR